MEIGRNLEKVFCGDLRHQGIALINEKKSPIVDEPAATGGLFSSDTFPAIATRFLDENPEILDILTSKPDSVIEFLSNYMTNSNMTFSDGKWRR